MTYLPSECPDIAPILTSLSITEQLSVRARVETDTLSQCFITITNQAKPVLTTRNQLYKSSVCFCVQLIYFDPGVT